MKRFFLLFIFSIPLFANAEDFSLYQSMTKKYSEDARIAGKEAMPESGDKLAIILLDVAKKAVDKEVASNLDVQCETLAGQINQGMRQGFKISAADETSGQEFIFALNNKADAINRMLNNINNYSRFYCFNKTEG